MISKKGQILNGLCPGFGLGPLSPVAYVRRAIKLLPLAALQIRGIGEDEEKGERGRHAREEKRRANMCAIVLAADLGELKRSLRCPGNDDLVVWTGAWAGLGGLLLVLP